MKVRPSVKPICEKCKIIPSISRSRADKHWGDRRSPPRGTGRGIIDGMLLWAAAQRSFSRGTTAGNHTLPGSFPPGSHGSNEPNIFGGVTYTWHVLRA